MNRSGPYIDVIVDEHEDLPEGCELRFHAVGPSRPIARIRYEPMTGPEGDFAVTARRRRGRAGHARRRFQRRDVGVDHRRRARPAATPTGRRARPDAEPAIAEPYLLLSPDAILD